MSRRNACRLLCGLLLAGPLCAQDTSVDRDVEFVRGLATELGFTTLAREEAERLQAAHRDSQDIKKILQLGIEISLIGARSHPNREQQRTSFKEAVDSSKAFIERYADNPVANRARRTMIEACYEYGSFLQETIEIARREAPERIDDLEKQASDIYKDGIDACGKVMEALEGRSGEDGSDAQRDYFVTWLYKAMLQRERARAVRADREPLANMARDTFEEFIFEVGEGTLLGLRGWFEMSKIGEVLGDYETAFSDYTDTLASIRKALEDAQKLQLDLGTQSYMFDLLQEAADRAADMLFRQGKIDETLAFCKEFRADLAKWGEAGKDAFDVAHPIFGHGVFLTEARAMAESGDPAKVSEALAAVQKINDAHPSDIVGVRAKAVLKDVLEVQADVVSGALLFEVAKGDFQARDYEKAIQGLKKAYGAMSEAERGKLGLQTWHMIALSFAFQERYLEAAMAASIGLERHGDTPDGAPEDTADVLDKAWRNFQLASKNAEAPALAGLREAHLTLTGKYGGAGSTAKLMWREAERQLAEKKYDEAAATFARVPVDTPYYELAQSRIVAAFQQKGDHAKARETAARYLEWTTKPEAAIPSDRADLLDSRKQAVAAIAFYEAYMDFLEAVGRVGGAPDPTRYEPTIEEFRRFIAEHGREGGRGYVPNAWDMIARLQAALGRIDKAEESYRTLRGLESNSPLLPGLATAIFYAHYENVKALTTEYDALVANQAPDGDLKPVAERLAEARRAAIASGTEYLENSPSPQYEVLYTTMSIARDAKDWKAAQRVGKRIIEVFENDPQQKDKVEKFVKAWLGEALLRDRKFREAADFLKNAEAANPTNYEVKRYLSLAQGGWYEFDRNGVLVEVMGTDEPAAAYRRHWDGYRKDLTAKGIPQYSLEWYEFTCETFMFAARAAKKDSAYAEWRDALFNSARSIDDFKKLQSYGPRGRELHDLFLSVPR